MTDIFKCTDCGDCCHIRERKDISAQQEEQYMQYMYSKFGIIYFAKLSQITINIWPQEKEVLQRLAAPRGIDMQIKPKRGFYNKEDNSLVIIDYYIDHDICPFYANGCTIYDERPTICQSYPLLTTQTIGKCRFKQQDPDNYTTEKGPAKKLESTTVRIKNIMQRLIEEGKIDPTIDPLEIHERIKSAQIVELRI